MNIQGMGQSYMTFPPINPSGNLAGAGSGFDPSTIDADQIIADKDTNADGVLSIEETPLSEDMFARADTDSDGSLTAEEMEEMLASGPPPMMAGGGGMMPPMGRMGGGMQEFDAASMIDSEDSDGDGSLSIEETEMSEELFDSLDTNQDGVVSAEELEEAAARTGENIKDLQSAYMGSGTTPGQAAQAYRQAMDSFMTNFGQSDYSGSNLDRFLETIA